jgi:hypothetical protein
MEDTNVKISFDEEYRLRVLESGQFTQTETLNQECTTFLDSKSFLAIRQPICFIMFYLYDD